MNIILRVNLHNFGKNKGDNKMKKRITKKIRDNFIFDKFNYCDKNNVIFKLTL